MDINLSSKLYFKLSARIFVEFYYFNKKIKSISRFYFIQKSCIIYITFCTYKSKQITCVFSPRFPVLIIALFRLELKKIKPRFSQ